MTRYLFNIKVCKECKVEKDLSSYYKHKAMADGHLNKCKECVKTRVNSHRGENLDKVRAYDRARGNRQTPEYLKEYRAAYPKKYKAHTAVNNAIRDGRLVNLKVCQECESTFHVEGHHDDYDKPLQVRWLCAVCHRQWHTQNGEAANAL